jgi:hypothetical protein
MKIKINKSQRNITENETDLDSVSLLVEPDPNDSNFIRVRIDLWNEILALYSQTHQTISEATDDEISNYCNKHDYYALKDILIKLNALSMASKGNLLKGKK